MKHPLKSKTILAQTALIVSALSLEEVRGLLCEHGTISAIIWGVVTIFLRSFGSNISTRKPERSLNLINMDKRRHR